MSSQFDNIKATAEAYAAVKIKIDELTELKKRYEAEIKPILADQGTQQFGDYILDCKTGPGRKTLDRDALEATYGDLSEFMKQGKPIMRMTVKKLGS